MPQSMSKLSMDSNSWLEALFTLASLWRLLYIDLPMLAMLRLMGAAEHMASSDELEEAKIEFRSCLNSALNGDLRVARDKFVGCMHNLAKYNFCAALVGDLAIDAKDSKKDSAISLIDESQKEDHHDNELDKELKKELDNELITDDVQVKDDDSEPRSDDNSCEVSNHALLIDQGPMEEAEALLQSEVVKEQQGAEQEGTDKQKGIGKDEEKEEKQEIELEDVQHEEKSLFTEDLLKQSDYIETLVESNDTTNLDENNETKEKKANLANNNSKKLNKTEEASEKNEENNRTNKSLFEQNQSLLDRKARKSDETQNTSKIENKETKFAYKKEENLFSKNRLIPKDLKPKLNPESFREPKNTVNPVELRSKLETFNALTEDKTEVNKRYSFQEVQKMLETSALPSELNLTEMEVDLELQSPLASSEDLDKIDSVTLKEDSKFKSATWTRKSTSKSAIKESNSFSMTSLKHNSHSDLEKIPRGIVSELHQGIEAKTKSTKISDRRPWMLHSLTGRSKSLSPMTRALEKSSDTKEDRKSKGESGRKGNNSNKGEATNSKGGNNVAKSTKQALKTFFKKGPELSRLSRKSRSSVTLTKTWEESRSFEHTVTWQSSKVVDLPDSFGLEVFKDNSSNNDDNEDDKAGVVAIKSSSGTNKQGTKGEWQKLKRSKSVKK